MRPLAVGCFDDMSMLDTEDLLGPPVSRVVLSWVGDFRQRFASLWGIMIWPVIRRSVPGNSAVVLRRSQAAVLVATHCPKNMDRGPTITLNPHTYPF